MRSCWQPPLVWLRVLTLAPAAHYLRCQHTASTHRFLFLAVLLLLPPQGHALGFAILAASSSGVIPGVAGQ